MNSPIAHRIEESAALDSFFRTDNWPSALVLEGDPGIGKTTLWQAALERARDLGFRVLSARASAAETVLAYAALSDLLSDVDDTVLAQLPTVQRAALDRVLLRAESPGAPTEPYAIAAAFLSVIGALAAQQRPLLLAIDDMQWLDPSSAQAITFVLRRLPHNAAVLATARSNDDTTSAPAPMQLPRPDAVRRVRVGPLPAGAIHAILVDRLGRAVPRPTLVRIHELSGGNPFYALELVNALDGRADVSDDVELPASLADLVAAKVAALTVDEQNVLLAAACLATPTTTVVAAAADAEADDVVAALEAAEAHGIITIAGTGIRFTHPLLARGVRDHAGPAARRKMHQRLAAVVAQPELRARHLAQAGIFGDSETIAALDDAADTARRRGAPAAAAELLDMAVALGGDSPQRRITAAQHHLDAGDLHTAADQLTATLDELTPGHLRATALYLLGMVHVYLDSYGDGIEFHNRALAEPFDDQYLHAQILVALGIAYLNAGALDPAADRLDEAIACATGPSSTQLLSQALGIRALVRFTRGDGLDTDGLKLAVELEDPAAQMRGALRPSMQNALLLAWSGDLDTAIVEIANVRRGCEERGDEPELMYAMFYSCVIRMWMGDFATAATEAADAVDRALQIGGNIAMFGAMTIRAAIAVYQGDVQRARTDTAAALDAGQRSESSTIMAMTVAHLGLLELSLGDHEAAYRTLEPLLAVFQVMPRACEIVVAGFVPDAAEALIALGRFTEAEPLVDRLETHGRRLGRAWLMAVGARCRAMLLAAKGDVASATGVAQEAMTYHDRLPMRFERARTLLLLGQLQRRGRQKERATATLREALAAFEDMGTALWAQRAAAELARVNVGPPTDSDGLTETERRVAELAASGMTNREVGAALFISPKTVEVNLSRVYRKLHIRSRAELGSKMAPRD